MRFLIPLLCLMVILAGCTGVPEKPDYAPGVTAEDFVAGIDHPYLPLIPGAHWVYEIDDEVITIRVLNETRTIMGVEATVVRDTVRVNGELEEDTWDWFAQHKDGSIWYLGEDTCHYKAGECIDDGGAWEWGQDGALPGIVLPANPGPGAAFFMEFAWPAAIDEGQVVAVGETVDTAFGTFTDTVTTHEWADLNPDDYEVVHYVRGIGVVAKGEPGEPAEVLVDYHIPPSSAN